MIQAVDLQFGRVLRALDRHEPTAIKIVIFTSDSGGERFSHTWQITGIRTELWQRGLRALALICWPARIQAEQVSNKVAMTMGWFATLLEAAGLAPAHDHPPRGVSRLPMPTRNKLPAPRKPFWRFRTNAQRALQDGDYQYLQIGENSFSVRFRRESARTSGTWTITLPDRLSSEWLACNARDAARDPGQPRRDIYGGAIG
jgi:arylsulfatase A-like enzyme